MKNFCNAVLPILLFAFFANAQEAPLPLSKDSSLAIPPDSSSVAKQGTPPIQQGIYGFPIVNSGTLEISEKKSHKKETYKKCEESNPEDYKKNLRVGVYFHPLPFIFGAKYNMFMFTSTVEVPLSLSNSVIIQPSLWLGSSDGFIPDVVKVIYFSDDEVEYKKLKRVGTGIGLRNYVFNKGEGLFLSLVASTYYISAEKIQKRESDSDDYWGEKIKLWKKVEGRIGELMFYVGATHKWQNISLSYEAGLGFGYDGTETYQMGYANKLATNLNVIVGIPF